MPQKRRKTVWRVEGPGGVGPYTQGKPGRLSAHDEVREIAFELSGDRDQPDASTDFPTDAYELIIRRGYLYGFESPEAARAWFGDEALDKMRALGFVLREVPATKVIRSKSGAQVGFLPGDERLRPRARRRASSLRWTCVTCHKEGRGAPPERCPYCLTLGEGWSRGPQPV